MKGVLHSTLQSLLQRGETLDLLVARSEELNESARRFYGSAKKAGAGAAAA
jgi:hypothetical protein